MRYLLMALASLLVLAACTAGPECASPYITHGDTCCLDRDANAICDVDENSSLTQTGQGSGLDCSLCPPTFVTQTEEVTVYRYVCENGSTMLTAADCGRRVVSNAHLFTVNEVGDPAFEVFASRSACRGNSQAAEVHIVFAQNPMWVTLQARSSPTGPYVDIVTRNGSNEIIDDEYFYLGFCAPSECGMITDGQLSAETAHVFRAKAGYAAGEIFSSDLLVDPTPEGEYGQKRCS